MDNYRTVKYFIYVRLSVSVERTYFLYSKKFGLAPLIVLVIYNGYLNV